MNGFIKNYNKNVPQMVLHLYAIYIFYIYLFSFRTNIWLRHWFCEIHPNSWLASGDRVNLGQSCLYSTLISLLSFLRSPPSLTPVALRGREMWTKAAMLNHWGDGLNVIKRCHITLCCIHWTTQQVQENTWDECRRQSSGNVSIITAHVHAHIMRVFIYLQSHGITWVFQHEDMNNWRRFVNPVIVALWFLNLKILAIPILTSLICSVWYFEMVKYICMWKMSVMCLTF